MNKLNLASLSVLLFCLCSSVPGINYAQSATSKVKINYVSDGDTFYGEKENGSKIIIRLAEVDCPEKNQPYGLEAKAFVKDLIEKKNVKINVLSIDRYGRSISAVDVNGKDLASIIVENGYAWRYDQYSDSELLDSLENNARTRKIGLWGDEQNPIEPWIWRRRKNK